MVRVSLLWSINLTSTQDWQCDATYPKIHRSLQSSEKGHLRICYRLDSFKFNNSYEIHSFSEYAVCRFESVLPIFKAKDFILRADTWVRVVIIHPGRWNRCELKRSMGAEFLWQNNPVSAKSYQREATWLTSASDCREMDTQIYGWVGFACGRIEDLQ